MQKRLTPEELECLVDRGAAAIVQGKDNTQRNRMRNTVNRSCKTPGGQAPWFQVIIELDAKGKVLRVSQQTHGGATSNTLQCVQRGLRGLTFPCLAGQRIVPESVIIE